MEEHSLDFPREPEPPEAVQGTLRRWVRSAIEAMETKRHPPARGPDPDYDSGLRDLEDIRKIIKEELSGHTSHVYYGNHHEPPRRDPEKETRKVAWEVFGKIVLWAITAAVAFAYGRLWDHEHRISVIEGEIPHVRSP